jgi:FtsP/CotA-like multicopper oxidase with cupredoxin domain
MTRNQRIALVFAALAVAVVAFIALRAGGDEDANTGARPTTTQAQEAPVARIQIKGGSAVGGVRDITVKKGDTVRIVVTTDAPDEVHLHGYDIEKEVAPGRPARFRFKADAEGAFEIESHVAEDAGREPLLARLVVEPS